MPSSPSIPPDARAPSVFGRSLSELASPILTRLSHVSAPFISTFLLIHLSAPAVANLGGSSLSSQVILLGREYYQGTFSEPWLLFAPLGIHITAGITKRLLSATPFPRSPSLLTMTAYPLLLFLPIHIMTHRIFPSDPAPPIYSLSPSELNFEFVKVGLATWPVRSWVLYAGLVTCGVVHSLEGWNVILRMWGFRKGLRKATRRLLAGFSIGTVMSGLIFVHKEPLHLLQATVSRIQASYINSLVYRI